MSHSVAELLSTVSSRLADLRRYRALYDRELALDFDPIGQFWGLQENVSSKVLALFFDPNEAHAQGDVFLRAFLELMWRETGNDSLSEIIRKNQLPQVDVRTEFTTPITEHCEGGRIDIVLFFDSPTFCVAIENKLGAPDQEDQIDRYQGYLKDSKYCKSHVLVYLTPDGREPSKYSKKEKIKEEEKASFCLLSWQRDMKDLANTWRGLCQAERVRFFLKDFSYAIDRKLGGGSCMDEEKAVGEQILESPESFNAAAAIFDAWAFVQNELIKKFKKEMEEIAIEKELKVKFFKDFGVKDEGFTLWHNDWHQFFISFEFSANNFKNMIYGICYQNDPPDRDPNIERSVEIIKGAAHRDDSQKPSDYYPIHYCMESKFQNWDTTLVLRNIQEGRSSELYTCIVEKIDYLRPIIDDAEDVLR